MRAKEEEVKSTPFFWQYNWVNDVPFAKVKKERQKGKKEGGKKGREGAEKKGKGGRTERGRKEGKEKCELQKKTISSYFCQLNLKNQTSHMWYML